MPETMSPATFAPLEEWQTDDLADRIGALDRESRLVLTLFHLEGLSLDAIGEVLGRPGDEIACLFYLANVTLGTVAA